ncbi:MAG: DNA polymerase III subunit epsilon [Rickettsiales bacterium]|nr:DNA polymerase III subunit epsilon [Rickettsiales bacterium]
MREIVLDTETTGLKFTEGDRIIEIGCVEIINKVRTGKYFHKYINSPKESSAGALKVHGLTKEFLADKPEFHEISKEFIDFLSDSPLVIHNAKFDMGFINHEFSLLSIKQLPNQIIDSLILARQKFPGAANNLDALCKRFNIDSSKRIKHGALLDAELLADVYLELCGGSQISLSLNDDNEKKEKKTKKTIFPHREYSLSQEEKYLHKEMLKDITEPLWKTKHN